MTTIKDSEHKLTKSCRKSPPVDGDERDPQITQIYADLKAKKGPQITRNIKTKIGDN